MAFFYTMVSFFNNYIQIKYFLHIFHNDILNTATNHWKWTTNTEKYDASSAFLRMLQDFKYILILALQNTDTNVRQYLHCF